jgi:hypothetical protein
MWMNGDGRAARIAAKQEAGFIAESSVGHIFQSEFGDIILETAERAGPRKLNSENQLRGARGRDSRRTRNDGNLLI